MLLQLAVGLIVAYGGIVGVMYLTQRSLMYVTDIAHVSPAAAGLPQADEITLTTADNERLVAWHVAPQSDRPVILYLQGNGGSLRHRRDRFAQLVQGGFGVVAVSYRGFGGSSGSPSETGLLLDAAAGYAFCTDRYAAERIVVWGESLGSGVAVALASKQPVGRLILEAPFTSAAEVARLSYPLIPVSLLMKDQFRSDVRVGSDHCANLGAARRVRSRRSNRLRGTALCGDPCPQEVCALRQGRTRGARRARRDRRGARLPGNSACRSQLTVTAIHFASYCCMRIACRGWLRWAAKDGPAVSYRET